MSLSDQPSHIRQYIKELVHSDLLPVLTKALQDQLDFVVEVQGALHILYEDVLQPHHAPRLEAIAHYSQQLLSLVEERYKQPNTYSFTELFPEYVDGIGTFTKKLSSAHRELQKEQRFIRQEEDGWRVRTYKYAKRQGRRVSRFPMQVRNSFRKMLKKETLPYPPWIYHIPLRQLVLYHYRVALSEAVMSVLQDYYRVISITSRQVWQMADNVHTQVYTVLETLHDLPEDDLTALQKLCTTESEETFMSVCERIQRLIDNTENRLNIILEQAFEEFEYQYDRVGTVELGRGRFSHATIRKKNLRAERAFRQFVQGWRYALFALYEDWRLDEEYNKLCDAMLLIHFQMKKEAERKVIQVVVPKIETAENRIRQSLDAISQSGRAIKKTLTEQKNFVDQQLIRTLIPSTMASLYNQGLPLMLDQMQTEVARRIEDISERRGLVSDHDFDTPVKASEINYIAPRQIVSFETLPVLRQALLSAKEKVSHEISLVQKLINELGQISYFNLDSALSVYEDETDQVQKPREIAEEGLQRALKNAENIKVRLAEVYQYFQEDIRQAVGDFNSSILDLKDNNYVFELKLRIAKARAMERTRTLKRQTVRYLKNTLPRSLNLVRSGYQQGNQMISVYQKKMGFHTHTMTVSTEISDFLNETEAAISQLPYVYQRLFSVRPLEDIVFYEERTAEMEMLQEAFRNWEKGSYASTVLVGEKGSGITTITNFFLKNFSGKNRYHVVQADTMRKIYTEAALVQYLSQLLSESALTSLEEITAHLLQRKKKTIFVLENLEHFYLRKVGGFQCLKMLFELISRTQKQVFWLCSCTLYAWDFLDKTTRISSYFEYIVKIDNVRSQHLKEVILKRHRVSGYGIEYTPALSELNKKKFHKLSHAQQQEYLEDEYFQDLNQVTSGNFSIAQLFWLRSTQKVTDDIITIGSLKDIDFSFLKSTPLSQLLALHALLLHDGLTEQQYMEVAEHMRLAEGAEPGAKGSCLSLLQMHDDGLITKKEDVYLINPLLYRQVVALLQVKNFIH